MQKDIAFKKTTYNKPFSELLKESEEIAIEVEQRVRLGQLSISNDPTYKTIVVRQKMKNFFKKLF